MSDILDLFLDSQADDFNYALSSALLGVAGEWQLVEVDWLVACFAAAGPALEDGL